MKRLAIISIVFISVLAESQAPQSGGLTRIGGIAGENGDFGSVNRLVGMYSGGSVSVQVGKNRKWQLIDHTDSVSFEVKADGMRRSGHRPCRSGTRLPILRSAQSGRCFCNNR